MIKTFSLLIFCLLLIQTTAQTITSSNLPLIVINTNGQTIPDDPKITADMGIIYNGPGVRNNMTDAFNHYNGKIGIEIRGQSSQQFPMKAYSIELWDNAGNGINKSLFGLPSESDWVLYAPYNEKTLMHNFLAYTMSREMGHWAANCRYVEVVLNGEYIGIYVFMEKIKRNSGRVNITKLNTTDITGDAVTGGYIFSIDKEADAWYSAVRPNLSTDNQTIRYSYVTPKITAIVPEQRNYIKSYVDSFETALNSLQYQDKQTGWRKFADENSFIDYFLVNEVSRNVDGYRLSSYFYKDRQSKGGKIIAGPVWDYDLAFRNANYCKGSDTTGWAFQFNTVCPNDFWQMPFWWDRFFTDSAYEDNLRCRWKQLRQTTLSLSHINFLIDSIATLTTEARQRHFAKWPVLGQYLWPNPQPIATTYEGEIQTLKTWLADRLKWMDAHIPNKGACFDYPADAKESVMIKAFPNPFQEKLTIKVDARNNQPLYINIFDGKGRQLIADKLSLTTGRSIYEYVTNGWAAGMYLLYYKSGYGETGTIKLIKQ
jgi:CotH kinase protein/Secretion system C-terminal sorting domain